MEVGAVISHTHTQLTQAWLPRNLMHTKTCTRLQEWNIIVAALRRLRSCGDCEAQHMIALNRKSGRYHRFQLVSGEERQQRDGHDARHALAHPAHLRVELVQPASQTAPRLQANKHVSVAFHVSVARFQFQITLRSVCCRPPRNLDPRCSLTCS